MTIEDKAILRLQEAAQMSQQIYEKPLMITYSGGKDSDVLLHLAIKAKIPMEVVHSHTTVDMPETVRHVRDAFHQLENQGISCTVHMPTYKGKPVTMWTLIPQKRMAPTRIARYCCDILKENTGKGRFIATGVRWAESVNRKNRGTFEVLHNKKEKRLILQSDNEESRRLFETCRLKATRTCNPIIDWTDTDIWDYIRDNQIRTNMLYCHLIVLAVLVVRWLDVIADRRNFGCIQHINGHTFAHLIGCWRKESELDCVITIGKPEKMSSTGGCRTVCCRDS